MIHDSLIHFKTLSSHHNLGDLCVNSCNLSTTTPSFNVINR